MVAAAANAASLHEGERSPYDKIPPSNFELGSKPGVKEQWESLGEMTRGREKVAEKLGWRFGWKLGDHAEAASNPAGDAVSAKSDKKKNRTKRKSSLSATATAFDGVSLGDSATPLADEGPPPENGAASVRDGGGAAAVTGVGADGDGHDAGVTTNGTAASNGTAAADGATTTAVNFLSGAEFLEHAARAWGIGELHAGHAGHDPRLGGNNLLSPPHAVVRYVAAPRHTFFSGERWFRGWIETCSSDDCLGDFTATGPNRIRGVH